MTRRCNHHGWDKSQSVHAHGKRTARGSHLKIHGLVEGVAAYVHPGHMFLRCSLLPIPADTRHDADALFAYRLLLLVMT